MGTSIRRDTPAWIFFTYLSFGVALFMMCLGIYYLPVEPWVRGYLAIGLFFTVGSSFTLSKTIRDEHEAKQAEGRFISAG